MTRKFDKLITELLHENADTILQLSDEEIRAAQVLFSGATRRLEKDPVAAIQWVNGWASRRSA